MNDEYCAEGVRSEKVVIGSIMARERLVRRTCPKPPRQLQAVVR